VNRILAIIICFGLIGFTACEKPPKEPEQKVKASESEISKPAKRSIEEEKEEPSTMAEIKLSPPTKDEVGDPGEVAVIETDLGNIVLEFYPDVAPLHVANFKKLTHAGFYDGTTFHRVLPGFMIQGGDPNSKDDNPDNDGQGGPGYSIPAEFNDIKHVKGILSMARSQDPNSAGSQFFIMLGASPHLDNQYTVFGKTIKGMEVVDKIGSQKRDPSRAEDRARPGVVMKKVKIVKRSEIGL